MKKHTLKIPYHVNHNFYFLRELNLNVFNIIDKVRSGDEVILDFSGTKWFNAELSVLLSNYIELLLQKGISISLNGKISISVEAILRKNNFFPHYNLFEHLDDYYETTVGLTVKDSRDITSIDSYVEGVLFKSVERNISNEFLRYIKESIFEIVHNVRDHAESEKVFMCGQYYPNKDRLTFAISDIGVGLTEKVKIVNSEISTDEQAIEWGFMKGNTTKSSIDAGLGLYELRSKLKGQGSLIILTGNSYYKVNKDGKSQSDSFYNPINGTVIIMNFNVQNCLDNFELKPVNIQNIIW